MQSYQESASAFHLTMDHMLITLLLNKIISKIIGIPNCMNKSNINAMNLKHAHAIEQAQSVHIHCTHDRRGNTILGSDAWVINKYQRFLWH